MSSWVFISISYYFLSSFKEKNNKDLKNLQNELAETLKKRVFDENRLEGLKKKKFPNNPLFTKELLANFQIILNFYKEKTNSEAFKTMGLEIRPQEEYLTTLFFDYSLLKAGKFDLISFARKYGGKQEK